MDTVIILAPCAGWVTALDDVPDAVFATRMMGDGIAISPLEGVVRAPCDGVVSAIAPTRHSITLTLANGAQLLIHVGLDTFSLGGEGFDQVACSAGTAVKAGEVLLRFDLDGVALRARNIVTPIVVVNEGYAVVRPETGRVVGTAGRLFAVERLAGAAEGGATAGPCYRRSGAAGPGGLHARPSARVSAAAKPFDAEVTLHRGPQGASARSVVDMLALGVAEGDIIEIRASGPQAEGALAAVAAILFAAVDAKVSDVRGGSRFEGVCAAPGVAIGPVYQLSGIDYDVPADATHSAREEQAKLATARQRVAASLTDMGSDIAEAHVALLGDPELEAGASDRIAAGRSAARAWREASRDCADRLRASGNDRNVERAADLLDLERRVLAELGFAPPEEAVPPGSILVADELMPSFLLGPQAEAVAGIVTAHGGPTSHAALLAAAAGIPMLVAVGDAVLDIRSAEAAVLDASAGRFEAQPSPAAVAAARARAVTSQPSIRTPGLCRTKDGVRIEIFANLASAADARRAAAADAEGCGLLRTELLFARRGAPPTLDEQIECYAAIASALGERPMIIRTLDVGADKPLPWLPLPREENPALGFRGIRVSLAYPELLRDQFRAILSAVPAARCRIMVPMVVSPDEMRAARRMLDSVREELGIAPIALGAMIETPAAAVLAREIAAEADFLSIGTNDLTQYVLAADRANPKVASLVDALHPAVLRLVASTCAAARAQGRWVAVCGALAAQAEAVPLLVGFGVTELSVPAAMVAAIDAHVRGLRVIDCEALAARVLAAESPATVRRVLEGGSDAATA